MKRRTFVNSMLAGAAATAAPLVIRRARADSGLVLVDNTPLSGVFASIGQSATQGSKLAVAEHGGKVAGLPIDLQVLDTEGNAGKAARKVVEIIEKRKARYFVGAALSSTGLAISKEVNKAGGVFFTSVGADEVTGSDCNKSTFRWSVPTYGAIRETVTPLIESMPKAKRWYTITPRYVFGESLLKNAKNVFAEKGVELVGNSYHSLQEMEFSGYLANALAAKPDVLLLLNFGAQSEATLRQAMNFGIKQRMTIMVAWTAGLTQFRALGPDILDGVYLGAQYWHEVDTPGNKALVAACQKHYGINPGYVLVAEYIGAKLLLDAIAKVGNDPAAVVKQLEGYQYQGPTGEETIRAFDHQVIKNYYLLKGKSKSAMRNADDYAAVISSGKSFISRADSACKMA